MAKTTIQCVGSTYLSSENPNSNFSSATLLKTSRYFSSQTQYVAAAILRFTRPTALKYKSFKNVKLKYRLYNDFEYPYYEPLNYSIAPYQSNAPLSEVNFSNYQSKGSVGDMVEYSGTVYLGGATERTVDVTGLFQSNLLNDVFNVIIADGYFNNRGIISTENKQFVYGFNSAYPPTLEVEYEDVEQTPPTPIYPKNIYLKEPSSVLFSWQFNSTTEASQSSAIVEFKLSTASDYTSVSVPGSAHNITVDGSFPVGTYEWRVKTTNDAGEVSPYSEIATFTVIGKPAVPVITEPTNKALTTISWNASDQNACEIELKDSNGNVMVSELLATTVTSYKPNFFLKGSYSFRVRVKNSSDEWSDWAYKGFTISAAEPQAGTLQILPLETSVKAMFEIPEGLSAVLVRSDDNINFDIIAKLEGTEFVDDTVKPGTIYYYRLRTYSEGYKDTVSVVTKVDFEGAIFNSESKELHLKSSSDKFLIHSESVARETSATNYSGREYALIERGEFTSVSIKKRFFVTQEQKETVDLMAKEGSVYYRDSRRNAYPCAIISASYEAYMDDGYIVTLDLIRTDESEVIVNV